MRNLPYILLLAPLLAFTQVPQGVGYQGVATDANGIELVNQSISIRASIISASPTGTIEWQETHNTSTDTFGLFTLTIGQGTSTGNGAQISFADITWGANTHFLKIEMDVNGGTNYSHIGTNQMMSVPYALYAENANIDYDSIATILSNDSTFINNFSFGGNMVFGDHEELNLNSYYLGSNSYKSDTVLVDEDGFLIVRAFSSGGAGQINISVYYDSLLSPPNYVEHIWNGTGTNTMTVPIKKGCYFIIVKNNMNYTNPRWWPIVNGSSSSTSTIDSSYIDSLVQFYSSGNGGGCDYEFPEGLNGDVINIHLDGNYTYTVPVGKRLYITNTFSWNDKLMIDGLQLIESRGQNAYIHPFYPLIINSNQVISKSTSQSGGGMDIFLNGILVDEKIGIQGLTTQISNYTVPVGKKLYINYITNSGSSMQVNGINTYYSNLSNGGQYLTKQFIFSAGDVINNSQTQVINGYLADENFFADCGGGGGSVSSTVDSSYIDSLVQFYSSGSGGGCDFDYPDGLDGEPLELYFSGSQTYTVPSGKNLYIGYMTGSYGITINGVQIGSNVYNNGNNIICNEGDVLTSSAWGSNSTTIHGLLIDNISNLQVVNQIFSGSQSFTVPSGKKLYISYMTGNYGITIGGIQIGSNVYNNGKHIICEAGDIITSGAWSSYPTLMHGYLVDDNYFADCGGGGSSSSTVDSSYIDSLVQFYSSGSGGGFDLDYPDGLIGESFLFELVSDDPWSTPVSYTVPANKNLYITSFMAYNQNAELRINSSTIFKGYGNFNIAGDNNGHFSLPIICSSGDVLSAFEADCRINGILVDKNVDPISINGNFTVPNGKRLVVLNYFSDDWSGFSVDGIAVINGYYNLYTQQSLTNPPEARLSLKIPLIFDGGSNLVIDTSDLLNGYLVDENYFANSGGGGNNSGGGGNNSGGGGSSTNDDGFGDFTDNSQVNGYRIFYIKENKIYETDSSCSFDNLLYETKHPNALKHLFVDNINQELYFLQSPRQYSCYATRVMKTSMSNFNPKTVYIIENKLNNISDFTVNNSTGAIYWTAYGNPNSNKNGLFKYENSNLTTMFLYSSVGAVCLKPNGDVVWAESNNVRDEQGNVLFTTSGISTIEMLNYDNPTNTYFVGGSDYIYDDQGNLIYDSGGSTIVDMLMNNQMLYYSQNNTIGEVDFNGNNNRVINIYGASIPSMAIFEGGVITTTNSNVISFIPSHDYFYTVENTGSIFIAESSNFSDSLVFQSSSASNQPIKHMFVDNVNQELYFLESPCQTCPGTKVMKTSINNFNPQVIYIIPWSLFSLSDFTVNTSTGAIYWTSYGNPNTNKNGLFKYENSNLTTMFLYSSVGAVCLKPNGDVVWAESNNVRDEQGNVLFTTSGISTIEMLNYDNPTNTYFVGGSDYIYDDQGNLIYDSGGNTIEDFKLSYNTQQIIYSQCGIIGIVDYNGSNNYSINTKRASIGALDIY